MDVVFVGEIVVVGAVPFLLLLLLLLLFLLLSQWFLQVVYGKSMSDEFDRQGLSAMIDYWISPAAVKREFEATKSK